jgi:hypothetical protein
MGRIKVVKVEELHKEYDRILEGVCEKVKGMEGIIREQWSSRSSECLCQFHGR